MPNSVAWACIVINNSMKTMQSSGFATHLDPGGDC